ncbi:MAG TPA: EAL domain-containing protein [Usitatibacter sp.]|nr:EAL domain-containing protein [Usitatibacter sp.]
MSAVPAPAGPYAERSARLRAYGVLEAPEPLAALEDLVRRAQDVARFPVAWISFLDGARERLHARRGTALAELGAEGSIALALAQGHGPLFVEDALRSRWRAHPLVAEDPHARFIGIVPLAAPDGLVVGTLTVLDSKPRALTPAQRTALENLAALAVARLEAGLGAPGTEGKPPRGDPGGRSAMERLEGEIRRRRAVEEELERERGLLEAVLDSLASAFFLVSSDGAMLRWNASLAAAVGYADAEIARMHPGDFVSVHDRPQVEAALREVLEAGREVALEIEIVDRAGNVRPYAFAGRPLVLGGERFMIGVAGDITLRKRTERQMARAKERLDLALSGSRLALWDWDLRNDKVYFNESWSALLGEEPRELTCTGREVASWVHAEDREIFAAAVGNAAKGVSEGIDCEYRVANSEGGWTWIHSRGKVTQRDDSGRARRMTGTSTDVTKRKLAEERAEYLATRDPLTGLPNRAVLHDRLEQAVFNAARNQAGFAFMFIDLDRFKTINDSLGHQAGDELLKGVAARLTACVRAHDTVARLGGDEFAVILEGLRDRHHEGAQHVAEKMIAAMAAPMMVGSQPLSTSCSIGIGLYPADGRDGATLMKSADVAMYYAKEKGRNNYQFFSPGMNARAQERLSLESFLRLALKRGELALHYQPRVRIDTGELVAVEALIRWQHPRRGLLEPAEFIDVAEDSGLIVPIGEWALAEACARAREWRRSVRPGLRVAVNLSVGQVRDGARFYAAVERALASAGVEPAALELELTESHLMQNIPENAQLLNRLGALGVGISIDDFGTGYSSLSYLKKLPVDSIKIDSSFVRDMAEDPNDEAIIKAILAMAHSLKLSVVAEGVETRAQLEALRALGCDEYQGFHESPALAPAELEARYGRRAR